MAINKEIEEKLGLLSAEAQARYELVGYLVDLTQDMLGKEWKEKGEDLLSYERLFDFGNKVLGAKPEDFFKGAAIGLRLRVKSFMADSILSALQDSCLENEEMEIVISDNPLVQDTDGKDLMPVLEQKFARHPEFLEEALHEGLEDGISLVLEELRDSHHLPLGRWPRAVVEGFGLTKLTPIEDQEGLEGYINSDIGGLSLRSHYMPHSGMPVISLLLQPV